MAEPADPRQPSERYAAIESAYCDDQWGDVISQGQELLEDLSQQDPQAAPEGLRERLQLLMAHAHLYGFGDRHTAEELYGTVLRSRAEASLRLIAEQGLRHCDAPLPTRSGGSEAATAMATPPAAAHRPPDGPHLAPEDRPQPIAPSLESEAPRNEREPEALLEVAPVSIPEPPSLLDVPPAPSQPVMPWLEQGTVPEPPRDLPHPAQPGPLAQPLTATAAATTPSDSLIPDVIEEPELIEVHQADPRLAEDLELTIKDDVPQEPLEAATATATTLETLLPAPQAVEEEDPELLKGLLRVLIR